MGEIRGNQNSNMVETKGAEEKEVEELQYVQIMKSMNEQKGVQTTHVSCFPFESYFSLNFQNDSPSSYFFYIVTRFRYN